MTTYSWHLLQFSFLLLTLNSCFVVNELDTVRVKTIYNLELVKIKVAHRQVLLCFTHVV